MDCLNCFTCGLVEKCRDVVLEYTWEQLCYLIYYHENMEQFNEKLEQLTNKRISVQNQKEEAENNVQQVEEEVLRWLSNVDEILEKVQKLLEKNREKGECSIRSCPNPCLRYKLSKTAKEMAQQISEIIDKANFPTIAHRVPPPSLIELPTGVSNGGIDSRVKIKSQIMEALLDPSVRMVGLCGLGGVGKTTIAIDVANEEKILKQFNKVIMATVSQEKNIGKIQDQIIDQLSMKLDERTENGKAFRLIERLKQEKNMLLILDDLWEELELRKVGIPFVDVDQNNENEGCKILLTSRKEGLLSNRMKCQEIIEVGVLSEDEAWNLFGRIVGVSIDSSIKSIATDIVQKCGGLPLAIATAAKALKQKKGLHGWKDYHLRLKHLKRNFTGIKEVDTVLRLSYDDLSEEDKKIFLLAAMMSHDPLIEDLLMYSVGLNILEHAETMAHARGVIFDVVGKLKSLNLFLDSFSIHRFTIHDVYRDLALSIASDESNVVILRRSKLSEWPDEDNLEHCRGICLQESGISDLPEELQYPMLELFLLNSKKNNLAIPDMFFKSSKKLKLLALTNMHFSSLASLRFLKKLRALCLHSCVLGDTTEIRSLREIKVLSLAHSEIRELPIELAQLISLQMLNLSDCSKLEVIPPRLLSNLKELEVLYMSNSFDRWNDKQSIEASENTSLDELSDLPISSLDIRIPIVSILPENLFLHMTLERYQILIGEHWEWWDVNDESSKILRLGQKSGFHLTDGILKLLKEVEDLHICGSNGHKNVLCNDDGRGFPCLKHLQIESNDDIEYIVLDSAHHENMFPMLETLKLQNLKALENLCETLELQNFKSLFNNKVLFPKLETLELSNLNELISIWDDQISHNSYSNLTTITIESCGFQKLIPFHVLKSLNKLEEVDVSDCKMLETMFDVDKVNDTEEISSALSMTVPLKKLKLRNLPKLKNVWSNHFGQRNVSFPCLRSMYVEYCESLTSIFPTSIAKDTLRDLEKLSIENCGIEVIVGKDQVSEFVAPKFKFPKLTSLKLNRLSKLSNFYPHKHKLEFQCLQELSIVLCNELEIFEKEVSSSSRTYGEETTLDLKYPLLSQEKGIPTLEKFTLQGKQVETIGRVPFQLHHSPKLKHLSLSVQKSKHYWFTTSDLGWLRLSGDFEEALGGDNVAALVAPFPKLLVQNVSKLSPSLVSSSNLTHLSVRSCDGLTTLMTSSTARSLTHLMHLSVGYGYKLEEIITMQNGEDDVDKEIVFSKLKVLEFDRLRRLKRFCGHSYAFRFPLLDQLIIRECPRFTMFSPGEIDTPSLQSIQLWEDWETPNEIRIISNVNRTLYIQRFLSSKEVVLDEYDARMIRNDKFHADKYPQVEILRIEKFVDEGVAFPYTLLERFQNLKELHVDNCLFEELFPSSTSFDNLTVLKVSNCHQLLYLMKNSVAKSMVNLETLEVQDCKNLEEIVVEETNGSDLPPIFQKLELFQVKRCSLVKLAPSSASFDNLTVLKVSNCHQLLYLMTNSIAKSMVNLETLKVEDCEKLEEIVAEETNGSDLAPIFHKLKLFQVKRCSLVKLAPSSASFDSLTTLKISNCHQLVYLVTNSTLKSMVNLETLEVHDCEKMKEIARYNTNEDVEGEIVLHELRVLKLTLLPTLQTTEGGMDINTEYRATNAGVGTNFFKSIFCHNMVLLPTLEILKSSMLTNNSITLIWDNQRLHKSFSNLKTLIVSSCDSIKSVPLPVLKSLYNLEELKVEFCNKLEKVFGYEDLNDYYKERESSSAGVPLNIKHLEVSYCDGLTTLMTSSLARSLVHLTHLSVKWCDQIEEIITKEEGVDDEDKEILFTEMEILELYYLPRLKSFCGYNYTFRFPLLEQVTIHHCPHITMFCPGDVHAPILHSLRVDEFREKYIWKTDLNNTIQHLFTFEEVITTTWSMLLNANNVTTLTDVFPRVRRLFVESFKDEGVMFPYRSLERFPKMYQLYVEHSSFEEIFPSQDEISAFEGKIPSFRRLYIAYLDKLKNIWKDDFQLPPIHQNLRTVEIKSCCNLIKLAPSYALFKSLRKLSISGCHQLIYLVTISTAKSLVSLYRLEIHDCKKMEEIVMNETNEDVEGVIAFNELEKIELIDMPSLKMFSKTPHSFEFPELKEIKITGCPEMKMLCPGVLKTPQLSKVKIEERDIEMEDGGELNKVIQEYSYAKEN